MTGGLILPMHVSLRLRIAVLVGCLLSMVLLCLPVSVEEAVSGELTIVGAWEDEIYAQFCDAHPEVEVELKDDFFDSFDLLMQDMLSGGSAGDIYCIFVETGLEKLKARDMLAPVRSERVEQAISRCYPQIQGLLSQAGAVVAVPYTFDLYGWAYDPALWEALNLGKFPETYLEWLEVVAHWDEAYGNHPEYKLSGNILTKERLMDDLLRTYILQNETADAALTFDQDDFKACAQRIKEMQPLFELSDAQEEAYIMKPCMMLTHAQPLGTDMEGFPSNWTMPAQVNIEKEPLVYAQMQVMFINPNTENYDAALAYLETAIEAISPIGEAQISPEVNEPIADSNWSSEKEALLEEIEQCRTDMEDADAVEKADMQAYIDMLNQYISDKEADPWLASAEEIAAYRDVARHMYFAEHSAYLGYAQQSAYDELVGIGLQYVEGKLTQEAFIDRLNQAVYMRFTEGQ